MRHKSLILSVRCDASNILSRLNHSKYLCGDALQITPKIPESYEGDRIMLEGASGHIRLKLEGASGHIR